MAFLQAQGRDRAGGNGAHLQLRRRHGAGGGGGRRRGVAARLTEAGETVYRDRRGSRRRNAAARSGQRRGLVRARRRGKPRTLPEPPRPHQSRRPDFGQRHQHGGAALCQPGRDCPYEIVLVASNNPDAAGLELAEAEGVATFVLPHKGMARADHDAAMDAAIRAERRAIRGAGRLHAHPHPGFRHGLGGADAQHASLAAAQVQGPAHPRARDRGGRQPRRLLGPSRHRRTRRRAGARPDPGGDPARRQRRNASPRAC